jgi:hypothetical protein
MDEAEKAAAIPIGWPMIGQTAVKNKDNRVDSANSFPI